MWYLYVACDIYIYALSLDSRIFEKIRKAEEDQKAKEKEEAEKGMDTLSVSEPKPTEAVSPSKGKPKSAK